MTGLEELEESLRELDEENVLQIKQVIVRLLHRDETGYPPFRRFGTRTIDANRRALRLAVQEELGSTDEKVMIILRELFDEPTTQNDLLMRVLRRYRRYVEEAVGSDSDSD
ncbi:hypothetical protein EBZ80_10185 [bacterium]|nr:hypothetical protein [bacterium]